MHDAFPKIDNVQYNRSNFSGCALTGCSFLTKSFMPFDGLQMTPICTELGVRNVIKEERKKL